LIGGWSTQVTLPEKADVLISEIIGNEPLGERVLETTMDALKRLLKPNARLVPNKVKIFGLPVTIPSTELMKYTFVAETLRDWQSSYNIDFNPLAEASRNSSQPFFINPFSARDWESLSEPVQLAEVNLKSMSQLLIDNTLSVTANVSGRLDGVLIYFEIELGPTIQLSTNPAQTDKDCSWHSPVWILTEPLNLQTGDRFTVTYRYRATEDQYRVSVARNE
jgi:protein arginine N-methyltransferase 1